MKKKLKGEMVKKEVKETIYIIIFSVLFGLLFVYSLDGWLKQGHKSLWCSCDKLEEKILKTIEETHGMFIEEEYSGTTLENLDNSVAWIKKQGYYQYGAPEKRTFFIKGKPVILYTCKYRLNLK